VNALRISVGCAALLVAGLASAGRTAIVNEKQASETWKPDPTQQKFVPGYPSKAANPQSDACVTIGYLIQKDGSTTNFTELKSWNSAIPDRAPKPAESEPYVQISAAVVSRTKFVPVQPKAHPVYTSATFAFDGSKSLGEQAIRAHCLIDDLPTYVAELKEKAANQGIEHSREDKYRQQLSERQARAATRGRRYNGGFPPGNRHEHRPTRRNRPRHGRGRQGHHRHR
jgi:hypothetical protein